LLLVGSYVVLIHPTGEALVLLRPTRRTVAWLGCYVRSIGLVPKLKILFSFYVIATVLNDVYDAQLPSAYTEWVISAFAWVQINWVRTPPPHDSQVTLALGLIRDCISCSGIHHTPI